MSKKGKRILFILLLAIAAFLLVPRSRTVYGVSDGSAYCMVTETEDASAPWIWFNMSGGTMRFTSSRDIRMSLTTSGTVEFHNMNVHAVSDDGTQVWIFKVIDNDTLAFVARGSTIPVDSQGNAIMADGAQFKRVGE